jgi:hypothetical protein
MRSTEETSWKPLRTAGRGQARSPPIETHAATGGRGLARSRAAVDAHLIRKRSQVRILDRPLETAPVGEAWSRYAPGASPFLQCIGGSVAHPHRALIEVLGGAAVGIPNALARSRTLLDAREQQYGGRTFAAASGFLGRAAPGFTGRRRFRSGRDVVTGIAASATVLARLPRTSLSLSDSPSGRAIRAHLTQRRFGVIPTYRIAQGVLPIPGSLDEYLRGRSRQAVRTNIGHARALGIRCVPLSDVSQRRAYAALVDPDLTDPWKREQLLTRPEACCWIALDAGERPVGLAVVSIDVEAAILWSLTGHESPARWLLHTHVVDTLATAGVRHLVVNARMAPLLPPGIQYFQRLLGYRVVHVRLRD